MSEELTGGEGSSPARAGEATRQLIRRTRQVTRRQFPAEEKIRILLEGIRGEVAVSELCRREGIHPTIYNKWLKDFMEAGKGRLRGIRSGRPLQRKFVSCGRRMSGSSS
jgi:transposase-like protein